MPHDVYTAACARLQFWWELYGGAADPEPEIRRIAAETIPACTRGNLEILLFDRLAQLRAAEGGDDDDHAL